MLHIYSFQFIIFFIVTSLVIYLLNTKPYKNNVSNKKLLKNLLESFDLELPDELKEISNRQTNSR